MRFCTKCGKELTDYDRFCSRCGTPTGGGVASQGLVENIDVEYPEAESVRLVMAIGANTLEMRPSSGKFIEGTIEYNTPE